MNRSYIADLTPARARLLTMMQRYHEVDVASEIVEAARRDRVSSARLGELGIIDPHEQEAIQFVLDMDFRVGLPHMSEERERAQRVIAAALELQDQHEVWRLYGSAFFKPSPDRDYIAELMPYRRRILILNLDEIDVGHDIELLGKLFPRIVITGSLDVKKRTFGNSSPLTTPARMGALLFPQVAESFLRSKWRRHQSRSLIAMGVYPELMLNYNEEVVANGPLNLFRFQLGDDNDAPDTSIQLL